MSLSVRAALAIVALSACAESPMAPDRSGAGKADSPFDAADLIDGTAPAVGLLRFVNDPTVGPLIFEIHVELRRDTSENILAHRDGDGPGSDPFDDVAELDSVPGVGPATMQKLLDFAFHNHFIPAGDDPLGTYDDVAFSVVEADAVVALVNTATENALDHDVGLDSRAAAAIVSERPIPSVLALSELPRVGPAALEALKHAASVPGSPVEIGIISDLDKTIIPPAPSGQEFPDAPYPGMAELLTALEFGHDGNGAPSDIHFVTARQPDAVVGVPDWLEQNGVPTGEISTGISGVPFIASPEKIRDITEAIEARPAAQRFVLFGDSSHADPDAYRFIVEAFGDRIIVAFIHDVKDIPADKLVGLVLIANYAQAAKRLLGEGAISESQARDVMSAVVAGGEITQAEMDEMLK